MEKEKSDFNVRGFYSKLNFFSAVERAKMEARQRELEKQYFTEFEIVESNTFKKDDEQ